MDDFGINGDMELGDALVMNGAETLADPLDSIYDQVAPLLGLEPRERGEYNPADPRSPVGFVRRFADAQDAVRTPFHESDAFFDHQEDPLETLFRELHDCRRDIGILAREVLRLHELALSRGDDVESLVGALDGKVEEIAEAFLHAPAVSAVYAEASAHFHASAADG